MGMLLNRRARTCASPLGGGRAKIENSSRRHPRKLGLKRFLAMRREKWAGLFLGYLRRKIITANGSDVITPVFATQPALSTHARKPNLLPLVQRLIEARERGTDRSGGCPHRGEPGAEGRHASDRSERGFGGARAGERVGGFK